MNTITTEARYLSTILNSALSGIMGFRAVRNATGTIIDFEWTLVNPRAEEIVGRKAYDLIGKRLLEEMPGNAEDGLFDRYVRVVENGKSMAFEHYYAYEDVDNWFRIVAVKVDDGFVVTFLDITKRKIAEQELAAKHDELERFFTLALDLLCIATTDGVFLKLNKA